MSHDATKNTQIQINEEGAVLNIGPTGRQNISAGGQITLEEGIGAEAGTGVTAVEQLPLLHRTTLTFVGVEVDMTDAGSAGCHGAQKIYDFPAGLIEVVGAIVNLTTEADAIGEGTGIAATAALVASLGTSTVGTDNATLLGAEANIHPSIAGTLTDSEGALVGKTLPTQATLLSVASLTDSSSGTPGDTIAALPTLTDSPASQDALRDDLNTNVWPVLKNWIASVTAKVNAALAATNGRRLFDGTGTPKDVYLNLAVPNADSNGNSHVTLHGTVDLLWINHGDV